MMKGKGKSGGHGVQQHFLKQASDGGGGGGYKTTMCKFFLSGQCAKGDACTFSHGDEEAAMPSPAGQAPCKFFAQGMCNKGDACTFSHGGAAPAKGKGFAKGGFGAGPAAWGAPKGFAPAFGAAASKGATVFSGKGKMQLPCKFFAMGQCTKGWECSFAHSGPSGGAGAFGGPTGFGGKGKDFGKGKGKGKNSTKGKGHLLPRTRISEAPFSGTVVEWKGKFGWIECAEPIDHEKAAKKDGKLFVSKDDINGLELIEPGTTVEFHIWEDASGLGADDVNIV